MMLERLLAGEDALAADAARLGHVGGWGGL
jgi:hypothetical protein